MRGMIFGLVLIVAAISIGLFVWAAQLYHSAIQQREAVAAWHIDRLNAAQDLRYHFLIYKQEWKRILLRGHNPESYHRYLQSFYKTERRIRDEIDALKQELNPQGLPMRALSGFEREFYQAGRIYRDALRKFNDIDTDAQIAADTLTQHTSLDPAARTSELIAALETSRKARNVAISLDIDRVTRNIIIAMILGFGLTMIAVYAVITRMIMRPLNTGIQLAEDIARGDLDRQPADLNAAKEVQALLQALLYMQTKIKQTQHGHIMAREEAERSNLAKSEFLSRMSHELRTPLNAVLGYSQLLEMDQDNLHPRQQNYLEEIHKAGQHLLALINEVLDLARIERNKLEVELDDHDLNKLIEESIALSKPLAQQRSVRFYIDMPREPHYLVRGDEIRIKQVLINLISNAVKYNHEGGEVHVSYEPLGESFLRIKVTDTGNGIAESDMPLIFQPFERVGQNKLVEGAGIGLALSKRLVELMQGRIGVHSIPDKGSTFWVDLPAAGIRTGDEIDEAGDQGEFDQHKNSRKA